MDTNPYMDIYLHKGTSTSKWQYISILITMEIVRHFFTYYYPYVGLGINTGMDSLHVQEIKMTIFPHLLLHRVQQYLVCGVFSI